MVGITTVLKDFAAWKDTSFTFVRCGAERGDIARASAAEPGRGGMLGKKTTLGAGGCSQSPSSTARSHRMRPQLPQGTKHLTLGGRKRVQADAVPDTADRVQAPYGRAAAWAEGNLPVSAPRTLPCPGTYGKSPG